MGALVRVGKAAMGAVKGAGTLVELAELSVVALVGAGAALVAVVGLPAYLAWDLMHSGHVAGGVTVLGVVALLALNAVRDVRRRELSWLSAIVGAIVAVWCAYVIIRVVIA